MSEYREKPETCNGCPWEDKGVGYAAGSGPSTARIACVAESLGENEAKQGIPLVGWTGGELNRFLAQHGVKRTEVYADNVIRCKPPAGSKKTIPKEVIAYCTERHLKPALQLVKPNVIIALGEHSLNYLCPEPDKLIAPRGKGKPKQTKKSIMKFRGSLLYSEKFATKVVPTLHPAFLVKGEKGRVYYPFVEFDIGKGIRAGKTPEYTPLLENYNIRPTLDEVRAFFRKVREAKRVAFDIETSGGNWWNTAPLCVGFHCNGEALCLPLLSQGGTDYWSEYQHSFAVQMLAGILADESIVKVLQNAAYDIIVLESMGFKINGRIEDTMLKHHAIFPEKGVPHDLAFIGSVFSEVPYYKDDVKGEENFALFDDTRLRTYNCRDVKVTDEADSNMDSELDELGTRTTYELDRKLLRPLIRLQRRGILVHSGLLSDYRRQLDQEIEQTLDTIKLLVGSDFVGYNKRGRQTITPKRLKRFLFEELGLTPVGLTQSYEPRTDLDAMLELKDQAGANLESLFDAMIEWRKVEKIRTTYFDEFITDALGRVHTQLLQHVTPTGRLSSRNPNLQNVPDGIAKEIFIASPGYCFIERDYSQIEVRILAYIADDELLIEAFRQGVDIHDQNTADLFSIPLGTHNKNQRDFSKIYLYGGIMYGGSASTVRKQAMSRLYLRAKPHERKNVVIPTVKEIEVLQNAWLAKHLSVRLYQQGIETEVRKERKLTTCLGRTRIFLGSLHDIIRAAYNFPIQGTAADIISGAMLLLDEAMPEPNGMDLQVHDSILFEVRESEADRWIEETKRLMERPIRIGKHEVVFPTTCKVGRSWGKMQSIKE